MFQNTNLIYTEIQKRMQYLITFAFDTVAFVQLHAIPGESADFSLMDKTILTVFIKLFFIIVFVFWPCVAQKITQPDLLTNITIIIIRLFNVRNS